MISLQGSKRNIRSWKLIGKGKWGSIGLKATESRGNLNNFDCRLRHHVDVVNGRYRWCDCLPSFRIGSEVFYPRLAKGNGKLFQRGQRMDRFVESSARNSRCMCGDRIVGECPGEWEPGCDLGANKKYARTGKTPELSLEKLKIEVKNERNQEEW